MRRSQRRPNIRKDLTLYFRPTQDYTHALVWAFLERSHGAGNTGVTNKALKSLIERALLDYIRRHATDGQLREGVQEAPLPDSELLQRVHVLQTGGRQNPSRPDSASGATPSVERSQSRLAASHAAREQGQSKPVIEALRRAAGTDPGVEVKDEAFDEVDDDLFNVALPHDTDDPVPEDLLGEDVDEGASKERGDERDDETGRETSIETDELAMNAGKRHDRREHDGVETQRQSGETVKDSPTESPQTTDTRDRQANDSAGTRSSRTRFGMPDFSVFDDDD